MANNRFYVSISISHKSIKHSMLLSFWPLYFIVLFHLFIPRVFVIHTYKTIAYHWWLMQGLSCWIDKVYKFINIAQLDKYLKILSVIFACCKLIVPYYMPYALNLKPITKTIRRWKNAASGWKQRKHIAILIKSIFQTAKT